MAGSEDEKDMKETFLRGLKIFIGIVSVILLIFSVALGFIHLRHSGLHHWFDYVLLIWCCGWCLLAFIMFLGDADNADLGGTF